MATGYFLLDHKTAIPQCGYPRRGGAKASGTIILHDAEGGTDLVGADMGAESVANYIRNRTTFGSYHRLVDRDTRIKMAPIDYETWHSVPDNPWSVGISVAWNKADLARMTYAQRRSYYEPLALEVLDVRAEFAERGISVPIGRMLTAAETQAHRPGISTHSRTDPSRRSDPFGTGSKYEAELLAVLAELATNPTAPEEDMTPAESDRLKNVETAVDEIRSVLLGKIKDGSGATTPDQIWQRTLAGVRSLRAAQLAEVAVPVEVDVDASDVADALLARLTPAVAQSVADVLAARLAF